MKFTNRQLAVNMVFNIFAFGLNFVMNFFITSYITTRIGSEAYGFVKLASDFAGYASFLSIALNSMAMRYIMLARVNGDIAGSKEYYSSIAISNILLSIFLIIPATYIVIFLQRFVNIPKDLLFDVKFMFELTFINFILNLMFSTYSTCYYLTNKLYISSLFTTYSNIIRVGSTLLLFALFGANINYVSAGVLLSTLFVTAFNIYYSKKLIPELSISKKYFKVNKIKEVLQSGVWNSITKFSQIFSNGLDLLVTNVLISATMMGYLSIAKTIPSVMGGLVVSVAGVFSPNLMNLYAQGDMEGVKKTSKFAAKLMCFFAVIPNALLISMGRSFFALWVPNQPAALINGLSILALTNFTITSPMQPLYQIFIITNKVKQNSIAMILYGFVSIAVTLACIKYTNWGVYAIVIVSLINSLILALCYHLPFAARYIGLPWYTFYGEVLKVIITLVVNTAIGYGVSLLLPLSSWYYWFLGACITGSLGLLVNVFLVFNRQERSILMGKIRPFLAQIKHGKAPGITIQDVVK